MYAIIEADGRQYKVEEGRILNVAKVNADPGAELVFDKVLLTQNDQNVSVGSPYVPGAKVACEVLSHGRARKIVVFHFKRRNDFRKKQGHRQDFTRIKVKSIQAG